MLVWPHHSTQLISKTILQGKFKELRRRLEIGQCAMGILKRIFKDRGIRLTTQIIVQTLVLSIILYGAETWTIIKEENN